MANTEHLEVLKRGVDEWNRWRRKNPEVRPDLLEANFIGVNLAGLDLSDANLAGVVRSRDDLSGADLTGALLQGAFLRRTNLTRANLSGAILSNAHLPGANLNRATLFRADLTGANLQHANLSGTNLSGANLTAAGIFETNLHRLDLMAAEGLATVHHHGPSPVSPQTLRMSAGQIPDLFLKGCGFSDWAIEAAKLYNPDLRADEVIDLTYRIADMRTKAPIVPRSIFISYSNKDMDFIKMLEAQFDEDGIRSWRDVKDMVAGPIEQQIDRAIGAQKVVLLVLSENSIRSDWVEWEVRRARELQQFLQQNSEKTVHVLCPVAIDRSWWERNLWPGRLRAQVEEYNIVDLSEWQDRSAFEVQYQKLKKGLGIYYKDGGE